MQSFVYDLKNKKVQHQILFDITEYKAQEYFKDNFDQTKFGYCLSEEADRLNIINEYDAPYTVLRDPLLEALDDANTDHWSMHHTELNSHNVV
jgi:fructose-1,6-bisphosphatase